MENNNYNLVLEYRPGDYAYIAINNLDICLEYVPNTLNSIDMFTSNLTDEQLRNAIIRSNMVEGKYLNSPLKVISEHHRFDILTCDILDVVREFLESSDELDEDFKNKLYGYYKSIIEKIYFDDKFVNGVLKSFKKIKNEGTKRDLFLAIQELPYEKSKELYFKVYNELQKRDIDKTRKLEKLNDIE